MLDWLSVFLLGLLLPLVFGNLILRFILPLKRNHFALSLALAFGIGFGFLAQWMLFLGIAKIPFNLQIIAYPLFILTIVLLAISLKLASKSSFKKETDLPSCNTSTFPSSGSRLFWYISSFYISLVVIYVFWRSLTVPMLTWDALAIIGFKAKIFFCDGSLHRLNFPQSSYPLFVPFIQAWIAFCVNRWDEILVKIIFPFAFASYLIIHYYFLKVTTNKKWALGGVCLLISSPLLVYHATIGYREIFMMYYNCTAIVLLLLWNKDNNDAWLILASLFAGFTTFVKLEGTGYLFIHTLLLLLILWKNHALSIKSKLKKFLIFAIPSYLLCLPFHIYKSYLKISGMEGRTELAVSWEQWSRVPKLVNDILWNLFFSGNWNLIWLILLVSLIHHRKKARNHNESALLILTLFMYFAIYFIILTFSSAPIDNPTTLSRVILHFFPLSVLLIILLNYPHTLQERKNVNS